MTGKSLAALRHLSPEGARARMRVACDWWTPAGRRRPLVESAVLAQTRLRGSGGVAEAPWRRLWEWLSISSHPNRLVTNGARSPSEGAQSGPELFRDATIHRRTRVPLLQPIRLVERHCTARPSLHSLAQFGRLLEQQLRQSDNRVHRQVPATRSAGSGHAVGSLTF
jgi:hypothetical protein